MSAYPDVPPLALTRALVELAASTLAPHHIIRTKGVAEDQLRSGLPNPKVAVLPLHPRKVGNDPEDSGTEGEAA